VSLEVQKEGREVIYSRMAKRTINRTFCARVTYALITVQVNQSKVYFSGNCQT